MPQTNDILFHWIDKNIFTVMRYTNLPIYCRYRQYSISLIPYSYYHKNVTMISWFEHLSDGSSYGYPPHISDTTKQIYGKIIK